jgi:hypothetical protein
MYREIITPSADENNYSAFIDDSKQGQVEKRILAYIKKVISNSANGYCCVSQAVIRRALKVRKQSVTDACRAIVERGDLIRIEVKNKNRKNQKYYYFLPNAELSGNSNKSSFSQEGASTKEAYSKIEESLKIVAERIEAERIKIVPNFLEIESWKNLDKISLVEKYLDAGLMVTPLVEGKKFPPQGWSKEYLRTQSKDDLLNYFRQNPQSDVGCWMPNNFVVVDADDLDEFYRLTGGETWETLTVTSGREEGGLHFWFRHGGTIGSGAGIRPNLDYKSSGSLVVLPPSVHKSGAVYQWKNLVAPADAPQLIQNLYDTRENLKKDTELERVEAARWSSLPTLTADTVLTEKKRYKRLFPIGRRLRFRLDAEQVAAELHRLNQLCCRPPLNEERMRKLINDVLFGANKIDFRKD